MLINLFIKQQGHHLEYGMSERDGLIVTFHISLIIIIVIIIIISFSYYSYYY